MIMFNVFFLIDCLLVLVLVLQKGRVWDRGVKMKEGYVKYKISNFFYIYLQGESNEVNGQVGWQFVVCVWCSGG